MIVKLFEFRLIGYPRNLIATFCAVYRISLSDLSPENMRRWLNVGLL